jgi:hypothetical protein
VSGRLLLIGLLAAVLAGCGSGGAVAREGEKKEGTGKTEAAEKAPKSVPESLKHEAFLYFGLGNTGPVKYTFVRVEGDKPEAGTQSVELKAVGDGSADYVIRRDGALSALGVEDVQVRADGVYLVSSTLGTPEKPVLVMPSKLEPGSTWGGDHTLKSPDGSEVKYSGKSKFERKETLTVAGKSYETVLVSESAELELAGSKRSVSGKTWFASGVGVVRMRLEVKSADGKLVKSSIEIAEGS